MRLESLRCTVPCPECGRSIKLVAIRTASEIVGVSRKTMYQWIDKGWVSTARIASGRQLVCLTSLLHDSSREDRKRTA